MTTTSMGALALWSGLHMILMLGLALNVTRHRLNAGKDGFDETRLDKAIRAHGNNIEYVPIILFGIAILVLLGISSMWIHILCGTLLVARALHAHGIQQLEALPKSRILGNMGTWLVMLVTAIMLLLGWFSA